MVLPPPVSGEWEDALFWHGGVPITVSGVNSFNAFLKRGGTGTGSMNEIRPVDPLSEVRYEFQQFSFGQIRIDEIEYDYDVVIDRGKVGKRKKKLPRSSAKPSDTRRSLWKRRSRGNAVAWWWGRAKEDCQ